MSAMYRVGVGYLVLPAYSRLFSQGQLGWGVLLWFGCVLLSLRLVPAVLRKVLPYSQGMTEAWAARRRMAKRYDSYQWQKLIWFGVGMAVYSVLSGHSTGPSTVLTGFCLLTGGIGMLVWRKNAAQDMSERRDRDACRPAGGSSPSSGT